MSPATPAPPILSDPHWFSAFLDKVLSVSLALLGPAAPSRAYVSAGPPAPDCGQLTVHWDKLRPTARPTRSQQDPGGTKEIVSVADVVVTLQKCVTALTPEGGIPDAATLTAEGKAIADSVQALWFGLLAATLDGTLFPTQQRPPVLWRDLSQLTPQSGLAGCRATMEVTLA